MIKIWQRNLIEWLWTSGPFQTNFAIMFLVVLVSLEKQRSDLGSIVCQRCSAVVCSAIVWYISHI